MGGDDGGQTASVMVKHGGTLVAVGHRRVARINERRVAMLSEHKNRLRTHRHLDTTCCNLALTRRAQKSLTCFESSIVGLVVVS